MKNHGKKQAKNYIQKTNMKLNIRIVNFIAEKRLKKHRILPKNADLTKIFKTDLNYLHQAMVLFGRYTCKAIKPKCEECFLYEVCDSKDKILRK